MSATLGVCTARKFRTVVVTSQDGRTVVVM
jgi:hypothetical protein